jgi:hypothetical protein
MVAPPEMLPPFAQAALAAARPQMDIEARQSEATSEPSGKVLRLGLWE